MSSYISNICVDCADPWKLAHWWSDVLDLPVDDESKPGDEEVGLPLEATGGGYIFLRVPEGKVVKNRLHVCLRPADRTRDEEIERLLGLGAGLASDLRKPNGSGWAVLTDPEGNEFCVLRSEGELSGN
jgi:predicted enzyme related to lactoylglutathione lyase